ncbi:Uncharacterized protein TPAR_02205 [Tolypocladium paradoxum]|uniref:Tat pathway signal sequence n=1 Tax=Tolypocladium paradoxum TaxID=94208 RepID=A0A2S4L543_9HYPO|nr:Uncharacterized protein TPAR_02205 [Tolypocladium paradoxum]
MEHKNESDGSERWEEDATLLSPGYRESRSSLVDTRKRPSSTCVFWRLFPWILNVILATVGVNLWWRAQHQSCPYMWDSSSQPGAYSPADEAVEYMPKLFNNRFDGDLSPYQGWPTDETDARWQDLYNKGASVRIDKASHDRLLNKTARIPLAGYEQDHLVGLDVFHQLHCLNMIRMAFYPRRYNKSMVNPDGTVDFLEWMHMGKSNSPPPSTRHSNHCIESIRQSVMCHSDTSTVAYRWSDTAKVLRPRLDSVHMCRNFTKIREWAFARHVDVDNMRARVEHGQIVDYSTTTPDPVEAAEQKVPQDWTKTVHDM